MNKKNDFL